MVTKTKSAASEINPRRRLSILLIKPLRTSKEDLRERISYRYYSDWLEWMLLRYGKFGFKFAIRLTVRSFAPPKGPFVLRFHVLTMMDRKKCKTNLYVQTIVS